MWNKWLVLILCGLPLLAAEKNRDWQTGQVVESKVLTDPRDHAIATADKTYLVKGSAGNEDQALAVGATVRFAVEDKNLFLSIAGREYKLTVLGVRASSGAPAPKATAAVPAPAPVPAPVPAPAPAAPAPPPAPRAPAPPPPNVPAPSVAAQGQPALDNDAVVKMIVGGLKEDTVVSVIQARPGKYILSGDAVSALKAAGVPPSVLAAMTAKMQPQR